MPVFNNALAGAAGSGGAAADYKIERSLRFNSADSAHLSKTFTAGNRRTFTYSGWFKRQKSESMTNMLFTSYTNSSNRFYIGIQGNTDRLLMFGRVDGTDTMEVISDQVFRDFSAWYHLVVAVDTTQSTSSDRVKVYVNGEEIAVSFQTTPGQNVETYINAAAVHRIGNLDGNSLFNGYQADVHFVDGQALAPTDFGEPDDNGVWQPKEYTHSSATTSGSFTLVNNDFTWNDTRSSAPNDPDSGVLTDGVLNYADTFYGNPGANGAYLDIDMTGATAGEVYEVRYWNAAEAGGQTITATCKQIDSSGNDIAGTAQAQTWNQGQKWNTYPQTIASNCDKIRLIFSNNNNNSYGWGIGEVQVNFVPSNVNDFHLDFSDNSSDAALGYDAAGSNNWTVTGFSTQGFVNYSTGTFSVQSGGSMLYEAQAFNGSTSNGAIQNGIGSGTNEHTWTPSSPITGVTSLRIYMRRSDASGGDSNFQYKINTGSYVNSGIAQNGSGWVTPSSVPSTLSSISLKSIISNNSNGLGINAIEVNGTILTNNDGSGLDSLLDSPTNYDDGTNVGGNYATLSPVSTNNVVYENGNLHARKGPGTAWSVAVSNFGMTTGKWYCEITNQAGTTHQIGIVKLDEAVLTGSNVPIVDYTWGWGFINDGTQLRLRSDLFGGGNATDTLFGATGSNYVAGDIIGLAFDADNQEFSIYKNGTLVGNTTSSWTNAPTPGTYAFAISLNSSNAAVDFNFGQRPFAISSVPTGYKALCAQNLTDPTIADGSKEFDAITYDGNGTTKTISGLGFSPDLVWIKERTDSGGVSHYLGDTVRGVNKALQTNSNAAESTDNAYGYISAATSDGFTVTAGSSDNFYTNGSPEKYVSWTWDGGDLPLNSAYNQSEVWSSKLSTYLNSFGSEPVTNLFDGDTSTSFYSSSTSGSGIKFVPTTSITGSIELYLRNGDTANSTFSYSLDNGSTFINLTTTAGNGSYVSIGNQTISNTNGIIVRHVTTAGTNSVNWRAIKVDNKVLVDPGVIAVGSLNSSAYNQSQNWSALGTGDSSAPYNWEATFDGASASYGAIPPNGQAALVDFSSLSGGGISYSQSVVITYNRNSSAPDVTVNGSAIGATADGTDRTYTLSGSGTLTSVGTQTRTVAGSGDCGIKKIVVDGKELVDQGVTPDVNVPSVTATVRANATAGFSIVKYALSGSSAETIPHKLNAPLGFLITKATGTTNGWAIWHSSFSDTQGIAFSGTVGTKTWWDQSNMTSSVFAHTAGTTSSQGGDIIAYCFAPVNQYSSFGSFVGNGNSDGPFVFTGFKPRFLLVKNVDNSDGWSIWDAARDPDNEVVNKIEPTSNGPDGTNSVHKFDFLSNGFKVRGSWAGINGSGNKIIYAAFAEHPFKTARAR